MFDVFALFIKRGSQHFSSEHQQAAALPHTSGMERHFARYPCHMLIQAVTNIRLSQHTLVAVLLRGSK
jgi:hypothetical protein